MIYLAQIYEKYKYVVLGVGLISVNCCAKIMCSQTKNIVWSIDYAELILQVGALIRIPVMGSFWASSRSIMALMKYAMNPDN